MRAVACLLVLFLVLPGCVNESAPSSSSRQSQAATPTADDESGSLNGTVTDEELLPVAGAEIALLETNQLAKTDGAGQFTFNGLAPGMYTIVANRLGFEQAGKRVEVRQGEVTPLKLQLKRLVLAPEGYHVSIPSTFYITFGWGLFDAFVTWRFTNSTCNPCQRLIDFPRGPADALAEPVWKPSTDTPATNKVLYIWTERNIESTSTGLRGENVWSKYVDNREQHRFTETERSKLKEFKDFRINVGGGVTDVMVQQRVEVWFTAAYFQPLPDGFTALPPVS